MADEAGAPAPSASERTVQMNRARRSSLMAEASCAQKLPCDSSIDSGMADHDDDLDADDQIGSATSEIFSQIVDIFVRELRLQDTSPLTIEKGKGFVRDARNLIKKKIEVQQLKLRDRLLAWNNMRHDPPFCRLIDKVSFTCGVLCSFISIALIGRGTEIMVHWYTSLIVTLLSIRLYLYRNQGYQYFLADFCYFVTALLLAYLYVFSDSATLFLNIFSFANGPLAWAVPLWRNSLVFHDLDKITSCAIHMLPMLVSYQLRWFGNGAYSICTSGDATCSEVGFYNIAVLPLLPYVLWQFAYFLKTEVPFLRITKPVSVSKDEKLLTSYKWLVNGNESSRDQSIITKVLQLPPKKYRFIWFVILQFLYTLVAMIPVILYYHNMILHTCFIFVIIGSATWNGANFYVEVWTTRYKWRNAIQESVRKLSSSSSPTRGGGPQSSVDTNSATRKDQ